MCKEPDERSLFNCKRVEPEKTFPLDPNYPPQVKVMGKDVRREEKKVNLIIEQPWRRVKKSKGGNWKTVNEENEGG